MSLADKITICVISSIVHVRLVPAPDLPVFAATDSVSHIWFNPLLTRELDARELGFVLAHEVCHQVLATVERRQNREPFKWNMATDYAINALISGISIPDASQWQDGRLYRMPRGVLFDARYRNRVAEVIYEDLCRKQLKEGPTEITVVLTDGKGKALRLPGISDHHGGIDIHLPLELDADRRELLRGRLRAAVENYQANSGRGDLPADLLRSAGLLKAPKVPWQRVLHHYVDTILNGDDYSLAHPDKHYLEYDAVVPGHYSETVGTLAVALDTSGSMTEAAIREAAGELRGMVPNARDITLIVADCAVRQVVELDRLEDVLRNRSFYGGGGTDHVCVFEFIAKHHLNPRVFIGMTDLYSTFPEQKPPYPVLWLVPEGHGEAPWGKVIEL